ncbi:MAG: fibronectin type III domain-containing protein, partial [Anaerolineae bacterium]
MTHQRLLQRIGYLVLVLALLGGQVGGVVAQPVTTPVAGGDVSAASPDLGLTEPAQATAGAPENVDIAGPPTVALGQSIWYTATVGPLTTSVPITFTWETKGSPALTVVKTEELSTSESIFWTASGTHYITVTAENDLGSVSRVRKVWVEPPPQPDLTVTDITYYHDYDILQYQMMNVGDQTVTQDYTNRIWVGDTSFDDLITRDIAPGQRLYRMLSNENYPVVDCVGTSTVYRVQMDVLDDVRESNEDNNERQETIACDPYPPRITQIPTVTDITKYTAVVEWETNEDASSLVRYDTVKGAFSLSATPKEPTPTQVHRVTLERLTPGTTYEFKVVSSDAARNVVESRPATFETLPPDVT